MGREGLAALVGPVRWIDFERAAVSDMKTHKNLFPQICSFENFLLASKKAARGKRFRPQVLDFFKDFESNALQLLHELRTHVYETGSYRSFLIYEPKQRLIIPLCGTFRDRIVHHMLINIIGPLFERRFIFDSYANRVGKGTQDKNSSGRLFSRPTGSWHQKTSGAAHKGCGAFDSSMLRVKSLLQRFAGR